MSDRMALATGRLQLRPWRPGDFADVLEYAGDAEFSRFLPAVPFPYTINDAEQFVARCVAAPWETNPRFAIVFEGRVVGSVELRVLPGDRVAEVGYALARRFWGKGYMTEAAGAVIAWAFRSLDLVKIWATADAKNTASWRVMEKLGMQREGFLRSHRMGRGERADMVQYGLLRSEWRPGSSD